MNLVTADYAGDCQALCQNHPDCGAWSHYTEEGHTGHCLLHPGCGPPSSEGCLPAGDHKCPPPHPATRNSKCWCLSGAPAPDLSCLVGFLSPGLSFIQRTLCSQGAGQKYISDAIRTCDNNHKSY